ncbi:hypothetical protein QOZ80_3AG0230400 [Eleusine coracana subsp. coracana]|nr:hypothetical protein QOZ80_3AG0230400 [Eleusine coracana subsp. coracana]
MRKQHFIFSLVAPSRKYAGKKNGIFWNFAANFFDMMSQAKRAFGGKFFMEIFMIGAWQIWKQRNNLIFNRSNPSLQSWLFLFKQEAQLQAHRINKELDRHSFLAVINSLVPDPL